MSTPDDLITVLMPTSPIPEHPGMDTIAETVATIRDRLPEAEILIMVDGVRPEQAARRRSYQEYIRRLVYACQHEWHNVAPVIFDQFRHQAAMTAETLKLVTTPYVFFVEHDTPLHGPIPFDDLLRALGDKRVNLIRLYHEGVVPEPHRYLMLDGPETVEGVPLQATAQWSQRPHIADTGWYRRMIARYFGSAARTMIEDVVHGAEAALWRDRGKAGWDEFKTWIYLPPGDARRSGHSDGRKDDPKYPMRYRYDTEHTPYGAPAARRDEPDMLDVDPSEAHGVRLGLIVRAENRGLGIQTWELHRHLHPTRTLLVDMGGMSPYRMHVGRYPVDSTTVARCRPGDRFLGDENTARGLSLSDADLRAWLDGLDVVVSAETPYDFRVWQIARQLGVKTALIYNWEFFRYHVDDIPRPDLFIAPTPWHVREVPDALILPLGVDRDRLPYRHRSEARTILHVAGHAAAHDRNGTKVFLESLLYLDEPANIIIRSQTPGARVRQRFGEHLNVRVICDDIENYWDLYSAPASMPAPDILVSPRRYGGQSLPMVESLSTGMIVLMPDADPQNRVLPAGMLLPCTTTPGFDAQCGPIDFHNVDPQGLARRLTELLRNPAEVADLSAQGDRVAERLEWSAVLPDYHRMLRDLAS